MKQRFFKILVRNITISGILALILINSNVLLAAFVNSITNDPDFQLGFWSVTLVIVLYVGLWYLLVRFVGKNQKEKLTSKPYQSVYGVGWPLHSSIIGALLTILILLYGLYVNFAQPAEYLYYILIFIGTYVALGASSWIWIKYISKKQYEPKKAISDDNLIRSIFTYRMIRVCTCQKKLKGYIPLTRFSIIGIWTVILVLLPASVGAFLTYDIGKGQPSIGSLFLIACLFYLLQIIVRWIRYIKEKHSVGCASRRAYCESI